LLGGRPGLLDPRLGDGQLLGPRRVDLRLLLPLRLQLLAGLPLTLPGLGNGPLQPSDLLLGGARPAPYGVDLAAQLGQALTAVGGGPGGQREPAFLGSQLGLGLGPAPHGLLQQLLGLFQLGAEDLLALADLGRLAFEVLRVTAAALDGGGAEGVAVPFGGELLSAGY